MIEIGFRSGWHMANLHDLEHALIGYLSTANYYGNDKELYFAFEKDRMPDKDQVNPYHYEAEIRNITREPFDDARLGALSRTKETFSNIE